MDFYSLSSFKIIFIYIDSWPDLLSLRIVCKDFKIAVDQGNYHKGWKLQIKTVQQLENAKSFLKCLGNSEFDPNLFSFPSSDEMLTAPSWPKNDHLLGCTSSQTQSKEIDRRFFNRILGKKDVLTNPLKGIRITSRRIYFLDENRPDFEQTVVWDSFPRHALHQVSTHEFCRVSSSRPVYLSVIGDQIPEFKKVAKNDIIIHYIESKEKKCPELLPNTRGSVIESLVLIPNKLNNASFGLVNV